MDRRNVAYAFRRSAHLLEERGWSQGRGQAKDGSMCSVFAYGDAMHAGVIDVTEFLAGLRYLKKWLGVPSVVRWNDAPGRTLKEVLDAFRGAAFSLDPFYLAEDDEIGTLVIEAIPAEEPVLV